MTGVYGLGLLFLGVAALLNEMGYTTTKNHVSVVFQKWLILAVVSVTTYVLLVIGQLFQADGTLTVFSTQAIGTKELVQVGVVTLVVWGLTTAIAERTRTYVYLVLAVVVTVLFVPTVRLGQAFIGSTTITDFPGIAELTMMHVTIGCGAVVTAKIIGPRLGKYQQNKVYSLPSQSLFFVLFAVISAVFGWEAMIRFFVPETRIEQTAGFFYLLVLTGCATLVSYWSFELRRRKADISIVCNSALTSVVAATLIRTHVSIIWGLILACIIGIGMEQAVKFVDQRLRLDDPAGIIVTHLGGGIVGLGVLVLFDQNQGLLTTGQVAFFYTTSVDACIYVIYAVLILVVVLKALDIRFGVRITAEEERLGKDFAIYQIPTISGAGGTSLTYGLAVPTLDHGQMDNNIVEKKNDFSGNSADLQRYEIITNPDRLPLLIEELNAIGVTGMNVTNLSGFGVQKGRKTMYRGVESVTNLLPKVKVETIVSTVTYPEIMEAISRALYTGNMGDGKVFVSDIRDVVRVSSGVSGTEALRYPGQKKNH